MNEDVTRTVVMCSCHTEGIMIESDEECKLVYLSVMERYGRLPLTITERIRHAWKVFRTGKPYGDEIVLDTERVKCLMDLLQKALNDIEEPPSHEFR